VQSMANNLKVILASMTALLLCSVQADAQSPSDPKSMPTFAEVHRQFKTNLVTQLKSNQPIDAPPSGIFNLVQYNSPVGRLSAYLTPDPRDGRKHPAIIWITGGDCNSIGDVWSPAPPDNDQSASAYRNSGIVMMFPSLRGGNQNPGTREACYGELDDVVAAADFLSRQPDVDPARIYLGGHSTGGTLTLLVAEYSDRFRAVFSFGPVASIVNYDSDTFPLPFDKGNKLEVALRSPAVWLQSIKSPTFVFEGGEQPSNVESVAMMQKMKSSPAVQFHVIPGVTHFSILAPANRLIAKKILQDTASTVNIRFTENELRAISQSTVK